MKPAPSWPAAGCSSPTKMSKPREHANLDDGPVGLFDNSSSGPAPVAELMTVAEAATFFKISKSGVRRLQHARQLPFIKVGSGVRFARHDLVSYLARQRVAPLDS